MIIIPFIGLLNLLSLDVAKRGEEKYVSCVPLSEIYTQVLLHFNH